MRPGRVSVLRGMTGHNPLIGIRVDASVHLAKKMVYSNQDNY